MEYWRHRQAAPRLAHPCEEQLCYRSRDRRLESALDRVRQRRHLIAYDPVWHAWWPTGGHISRPPYKTRRWSDTVFSAGGYSLPWATVPGTDDWDPLGPLTLASTEELTCSSPGHSNRYAGLWLGPCPNHVAGSGERPPGRPWRGRTCSSRSAPWRAPCAACTTPGVLLAVAPTDNRRSAEHDLGRWAFRSARHPGCAADDGLVLNAGAGHGARDRPAGGRGSRARRPWWEIPLPIWRMARARLWLGRGGGVWRRAG